MSEEAPRTGFFLRGLRTLFLGLVACTVAMAIAYGTVRYLTRGRTPPGVPGTDYTVGPERRIPQLAAELERLADDFAEHLPLDIGGYSPQAEDWIRNTFRPAVAELRSELNAPGIKGHPAVRPLRKALDQAHYLAIHPADLALRRQTVKLMRDAHQKSWDILNPDAD